MKVWALRNPNGSFRGKFHRHDAYDCPGRRRGEEDRDDYALVELEELPGTHRACQFHTCFPGREDADAVSGKTRTTAERNLDRILHGTGASSPPAEKTPPSGEPIETGTTVGQRVEVRVGDSTAKELLTIVRGRADRAAGEISADSAVAKALLGREEGEVVDVTLPNGRHRQMEIVRVVKPDSS